MPSNHILINNASECFVPDSKMEELMQYLRTNAYDWQETTDKPLVSDIADKVASSSQS
jgi:hypothetical protein